MKKLQFLRRNVVLPRLLFPAVIADNDSARGKIRVRGVSCWLFPLVALSCLAQILRADFFEDFQYTDNGTEITIDYYMGIGDEFGAVVIPDSITGKPVTRIGNYSFRGRNEVTSVLIPGTVTSIGDYAFADCGGLAGMTIPESVTSLGEGAFSGCIGLTSVTIPASVTSIGKWAFSYSGLMSLAVPGSVSNIAEFTFGECYQLETVTMLSGVKSIEDRAFAYCGGLTTVIIPDSVTNIGVWAFERCTSLTTFSVDDANPHFSSAGGVLFDKAKTLVIRFPAGMSGIYTIPASVSLIGEFAFFDCDGLTGVTIPSGVTAIGEGAFNSCDGLANMIIPASVSSIGASALANCSALVSIEVADANPNFSSTDGVLFNQTKSLLIQCPAGIGGDYVIPTSVTRIGDGAFSGCGGSWESQHPVGLTSITIPSGVTSIGNSAFSGCNRLTSITIPPVVTRIEDWTFNECFGLTSVTIPNGVTRIGVGAFSGCGMPWNSELPGGLESITIPNTVTSIGDWAFNNCNRLTSINIPDSVTRIGDYTFAGCAALTSMTIPSGVTSIGEWAFSCGDDWRWHETPGGLSSVTIPDTVITIGKGAFYGCRQLAAVNIPDSVINLGAYAFARCSGLTSVKISASLTSIPDWLFSECTALEDVIIPSGVTSIGEGAFACGDYGSGNQTPIGLTSVTIPDSVVTLGSHAFAGCNRLAAVTIPNSVITIGNYAFTGCNRLAAVTIPDSVTSIGHSAFLGCSSLTSVAIPDSVINLGEYAFARCSGLTSVTISASLTSIAYRLFSQCTSLEEVVIPSGVTSIEDGAFACDDYGWWNETPVGLTAITIPGTVTSIGSQAFAGCNRLTSVIIPNSVVSIGYSTFQGCGTLTSVEIPASTTSIEEAAFSNCRLLTSISVAVSNPNYGRSGGVLYNKAKTTLIQCPAGLSGVYMIPEGVISIGNGAFLGCSELTGLNIPTSVTSIGYQAFWGCSGLTSITIPTGVTRIEDSLFFDCSGLASITIPPGVNSIGSQAFWGCRGLTSIEIPDSVTSIGDSAFYGCSGLTFISVDEANPNFCSLDGVLFNKARTSLIQFPTGRRGTYVIPAGIARIEANAFADCAGLTSVTFPPHVTNIEYNAFSGCSGLTQVTIPSSVTNIGGSAFGGCSNLTSAVFAGNAPSMDWGVFDSATSDFTVYFFNGRTGFTTPTWQGYPAVAMDPAPVVITGAASGITAESAILQGTVNPNGATTITQFEYGPTSAYGHVAAAILWPNNGTSTVTVSSSVSGLQPGQIYHYRLTATNPSGTSLGDDMTFGTDAALVVIASHGKVVPAAGHYPQGSTVELTATPSPGYVFGSWTGDVTGNGNPLSVLMDASKMITANFLPDLIDNDGDGLSNHDEIIIYGTHVDLTDTDGDGLSDASEVGLGHYWIIAGTFTWAQARADAHARGGELACFPMAARWNRAMESLGAIALDGYTGLWIGASDAAEEGKWTWVNGEPFTFSQWATSRPSATAGNTLDYAEVSGGGGAELEKWYDRTATTTRDGYILESGYLTDPSNADVDSDGLNDGAEKAAGSNPFLADTDGDGFDDGFEVNAGFNPTLAGSTPEGVASIRNVPGLLPAAVEFRFNAANGVSYRIEDSSDLNDWHIIETDIIGQGSTVTRTYSTPNLPQRFFRAGRN